MVPGAGIEPARCFQRGILSPVRLPIPPSRQRSGHYPLFEAFRQHAALGRAIEALEQPPVARDIDFVRPVLETSDVFPTRIVYPAAGRTCQEWQIDCIVTASVGGGQANT